MANVIESAAEIAMAAGLRLELAVVLFDDAYGWLDQARDKNSGITAREQIVRALNVDPPPLARLFRLYSQVIEYHAQRAQHEGQA